MIIQNEMFRLDDGSHQRTLADQAVSSGKMNVLYALNEVVAQNVLGDATILIRRRLDLISIL